MVFSEAEARRFLERDVQPGVVPLLTTQEMDDLMLFARAVDEYGTPPDTYLSWTPSAAIALNALRVPTIRQGYVFIASVAGNTGVAEPVWPSVLGQTVVDNQVTWTAHDFAPWVLAWNIPHAAAKGWDWKAAKVVPKYNVKAGSVQALRKQVYDMCIEKRDYFRSISGMYSGMGSVLVSTMT